MVLSPPNSRLDGSTKVATIGKVHDQAQPAGPHEDLVAAPWAMVGVMEVSPTHPIPMTRWVNKNIRP